MMRGTRVAAIVLVALVAPAYGAEEDTPAKQTYLRYCSSCHGYAGKGDGSLANLMTPRPTDLTTIAKRNNGVFPADLAAHIDGTKTVRGHGESDMPVWGERLRADVSMSLAQAAEVRGKLQLILEHLRAIQMK